MSQNFCCFLFLPLSTPSLNPPAPSTDPTDLTLPQTPQPMERFWRSKERPPHLEWIDQWWKLGYLKNAMVCIGLPTRKIQKWSNMAKTLWLLVPCNMFRIHAQFLLWLLFPLTFRIPGTWHMQAMTTSNGDKQIQVENHLISRINQNSSLLCQWTILPVAWKRCLRLLRP